MTLCFVLTLGEVLKFDDNAIKKKKKSSISFDSVIRGTQGIL